MAELAYVNGRYGGPEEGGLSIEDRGFLFGDGVYEVVKVLEGTPLWLDQHLRRLDYSLRQIRIDLDASRHPIAEIVGNLISRAELGTGTVYLQVTRGVSPRDFTFPASADPTVVALARPQAFPHEARIRRGLTLYPMDDIRWARCDIKSTNLLGAVMAKNEAKEAGFDEALWLGPGQVVREGGSSNVFAVLDGALRTHPADNRILNGITRLNVLRLARGLGLSVREEAVALSELLAAEEVFIASTTNDVMPVLSVGDRAIGQGTPGKITLRLVDALRAEAAALAGMAAPARLST